MHFSRIRRSILLSSACAAVAACGDGKGGGGGGITQPQPELGTVQVTIATTGRVLDRDGYSVALGATTQATINGTAAFSQVAAGAHTVTLDGVAENCQVQGASTANVTVTSGGTAQASFAVVCQANRVAYLAHDANGVLSLFTERTDGTDRRRLVGPVVDSRIAWSPDGYRIAYTAPGLGEQVWVVDAFTGTATQLTTERYRNTEPSWSPNGGSIVFRSQDEGFAHCDLWMMRADGSSQRALTSTAGFGMCLTFPDWSPDGTKIEFVTRGSAGSRVLQWADSTATTFGAAPATTPAPSPGGASWSPSSARVAFSATTLTDTGFSPAVYTSLYDGTDLQRVVITTGTIDSGIAWVNNTTLGYSLRTVSGGVATHEVWTIGADGTGAARSPVGAGLNATWVRWQ
jgi:hypothetical protein